MKNTPHPIARAVTMLLAFIAYAGVTGLAADFDSGSDGSYGAITIPAGLGNNITNIDVPPDGILRCTTVTIGANSRLRFVRNALNTPVYLLATGDVAINGFIDVTGANSYNTPVPGAGGPGGFDGGFGGFGDSAPLNHGGDGHGPGRGMNATGKNDAAYAAAASGNTGAYGNVLIVPLIGGSGGAGGNGNPGNSGGGGGGAILIASNTKITVNGAVLANGGGGYGGGGSGGAIRLVAPTGGGTGYLDVRGAQGGSVGRIRTDSTDNNAFRTLNLYGASTRGNRMFVFPASTPTLHLVEAAGQSIPVGTGAAVSVLLPAGSPTSQNVRVRGVGFTGSVPIRLVVTPENSASTSFDLTLDATQNPAEIATAVTLPTGENTRIEAWTR